LGKTLAPPLIIKATFSLTRVNLNPYVICSLLIVHGLLLIGHGSTFENSSVPHLPDVPPERLYNHISPAPLHY
ncbi:hypothetical protein, partial [Coleofasciculus sp.]|uniref:hypothetical protein n=1 Tax=Coleofasciculus sp. TaxID=3100458 RepID=UPI0039F83CBE